MDPFFLWLEATPLSQWVTQSTSVFAFPGILSAHAIGMGLAAGINATFALHILGAVRGIPSKELSRFVPFMWFGFWLNFFSGMLLLIGYPTKALTNPVFYLKLTLIAAAMGLFVLIRRRLFERPTGDDGAALDFASSRSLQFLAAASLVCWTGAITAGRLLAYTYTRLFANW
jgi:energy-coupling factor transporter transmembrane protein EcfT